MEFLTALEYDGKRGPTSDFPGEQEADDSPAIEP